MTLVRSKRIRYPLKTTWYYSLRHRFEKRSSRKGVIIIIGVRCCKFWHHTSTIESCTWTSFSLEYRISSRSMRKRTKAHANPSNFQNMVKFLITFLSMNPFGLHCSRWAYSPVPLQSENTLAGRCFVFFLLLNSAAGHGIFFRIVSTGRSYISIEL